MAANKNNLTAFATKDQDSESETALEVQIPIFRVLKCINSIFENSEKQKKKEED